MSGLPESIAVLHVDDEPDFGDLVAHFLQRDDDRFTVTTVTSAAEGLDRLANGGFDCVISDYQMPGMDGLEFLETIRVQDPDLPFILFTGRGSEEVASDAITAGATDYLQKQSGTEQYQLLANRVRNAVEQYGAHRRAVNLERIRNLAADVNHALVRASTREEIEATVSELLSRAEPYVFAWIGEVDQGSGRLEPRAWAGDGEGFIDAISRGSDQPMVDQGPSASAVDGRLVVSQDIEGGSGSESWREAAAERGFRSVAAVPLVFDDRCFGVLTVYANRTDVFDESEQELLEELGDDIGHAIDTIVTRNLLRSQKERFQQLVESATVSIVMIDTDSEIQFANAATEDVFGYDPDDLVGESLTHLMPERYRDRHRAGLARYLESGERQVDWTWVEFPGLRKDGQEIELSISFGEFERSGERYFEGIIREITS